MADTTWRVSHYQSGISGGATNVWENSEITLRFGGDGTVSGSAGCNEYTGNFELEGTYESDPGLGEEEDGQLLGIELLSVTDQVCEDENIMEQEGEYLEIFQTVGRWSLGGGFAGPGLILSTEDGSFLVEAQPAD